MAIDKLTTDEKSMVETLHSNLAHYQTKNRIVEKLYDGSHIPETFGISVPPKMQNLKAVLGWPSIVIDTLEERLDFFGYNDPLDLGLNEVFTDNGLEVESSIVHHDSLLTGTGFAVVGTGFLGEPDVLVTMESPDVITAVWDKRLRRASMAYSYDASDKTAQLYLPNETIYLLKDGANWRVLTRDQHKLGRVPVVRFDNRMRSTGHGQSEINEAVQYFTDAAARTAIRMEIASEFYSAPKEVILGGDRDLLTDKDGNPVSQWTPYMGRVQQIPWNDDEDSKTNPNVIQLDPSDPKPFIDQINLFGSQLASQKGFPASYLGLVTNMPTSADAIKAGEIRLVKHAERRQKIFSQAWLEVARLALLVRDGAVPEEFNKNVSAQWMDPSTPTRAATVDAVVKLVSQGIIPADSSVVADELNLTPGQRNALAAERTKARAQSMVRALVPPALPTDEA